MKVKTYLGLLGFKQEFITTLLDIESLKEMGVDSNTKISIFHLKIINYTLAKSIGNEALSNREKALATLVNKNSYDIHSKQHRKKIKKAMCKMFKDSTITFSQEITQPLGKEEGFFDPICEYYEYNKEPILTISVVVASVLSYGDYKYCKDYNGEEEE